MFGSESNFEQSGLLRSGKRYKRNLESYTLGQNTKYMSLSPKDQESEETIFVRNPPRTPQRRSITLENPSESKNNPSPSIPVTGQSTSVSYPSPTTIPPPSPPKPTMAHMNDDIKLPVFKGTGSEDPEHFWFLCEAVWTAKNTTDQDTKECSWLLLSETVL